MDKTTLVIAGSGKLADAIFNSDEIAKLFHVVRWDNFSPNPGSRVLVAHAGSGRQLEEIYAFCRSSMSTLLELSTGTVTESRSFDFPLVMCPNTAILLVKFLYLLSMSDSLFKGYAIRIDESHQATKTSRAGTAAEIARRLGVGEEKIFSNRDPVLQKKLLGIPENFLDRHAYHRVLIEDGDSSIVMETKVLGHEPYVTGVAAIAKAVLNATLENRTYSVTDLVREGLL